MSAIANLDISSANTTAVLTVEDLFPAGIQLQMFTADKALAMGTDISVAETRKGIDGKMVAGYTPVIYPVTITLEASSPSVKALATVWQAMSLNRRVYACNLVCTVPSIRTVFLWSTGVLKSGTPMPELGAQLGSTTWLFNFQDFERQGI